jgi:hypothetical protein
MNIDPAKAKQLGCTSTCPVPLRMGNGEMITHELPCTPHNHGLSVVLVRAGFDVKRDVPILGARVTHIASGFALDHATLGSYPATKVGMAAALHELAAVLPLADWTQPADALERNKLDVEIAIRRCRSAFPGKLVGNVVAHDVAKPPPEIVKWRVYSQDTTTGWSFADLAHEDHLLSAVDEALTKTGEPLSIDVSALAWFASGKLTAYALGHVLRVFEPVDGTRIAAVVGSPTGFDLCCEQRAALIETLTQAEHDLRGVDNPRKTLGVWKSGPKFGQLKLAAKLPPEQCVEVLTQQDQYDTQARKVEALRADLRHLEMLLAESEPIPERVTKLCPRETPNGKEDAIKLLGMLRMQTTHRSFSGHANGLMFDKCISQLESYLREYESVERYGFAPGSRCTFVGDGETDSEVEIEDVIVSRGERWSAEPVWWHERDVVFSNGDRSCVAVSRLRAVP